MLWQALRMRSRIALAIRRFPGKQVLRRFGLRAKIVADKIGDPLGAGKIQIVFSSQNNR